MTEPRIVDEQDVVDLPTEPKVCPDCGVEPGLEHLDVGCDVARCLMNGEQRLLHQMPEETVELLFGGSVYRPPAHECGRDVWTGTWPGVDDAAEAGWFCYWHPPGPGLQFGEWVRCGPDHPGARRVGAVAEAVTELQALSVGDIYCPSCLAEAPEVLFEDGDFLFECRRCPWTGTNTEWPYDGEACDWDWVGKRRPNLGCPVCGTCNIDGGPWRPIGEWWAWECRRAMCGFQWVGRMVYPAGRPGRWLIRYPVDQVPYERVMTHWEFAHAMAPLIMAALLDPIS